MFSFSYYSITYGVRPRRPSPNRRQFKHYVPYKLKETDRVIIKDTISANIEKIIPNHRRENNPEYNVISM